MRARLVRSSPHGRPRAPVTAVVAAVVATTLTACGQDASTGAFDPNGSLADNTRTTTPATAPSTLPTAQVNKTVLARYREYRKVFKNAYANNDPSQLSTVAMDPLLKETTQDIQNIKAKGQVWRFTTISNAKVYGHAKDGRTVYVVDCIRTLGGYRFSTESGERLGGGRGGAFLHRVALRYDQGTWKVFDSVRDKQC